jgi:nucleoside phosphorylase
MNVKSEFLSQVGSRWGGGSAPANLTALCNWLLQQSATRSSEGNLRDFSVVLIEISASIKVQYDRSSEHCQRMAATLYLLSLDFADAVEKWEHAVTAAEVEGRGQSARQAQVALIDALKKVDALCPWHGFADWLGRAPELKATGEGGGMTVGDLKGTVDFAIITIKQEEFEAVLERFPGENHVKGERYYSVGRVEAAGDRSYVVAVARCTFQGTGEAQAVARDIVDDLDPQWILAVGIAGAVPASEFTLGDVVLSTKVIDYSVRAVSHGRPDEFAVAGGPGLKDVTNLVSFLPAKKPHLQGWNEPESIGREHPPVDTRDEAIAAYGDEQWQQKVRESVKRHFGSLTSPRKPLFVSGAIISSDALVKDPELIEQWLQTARDAVAVEMESAGIYRTARSGKKEYPFLAIRGMSDVIGLKRHPDWTAYACHTAAAFAHAFVKGGFIESRH